MTCIDGAGAAGGATALSTAAATTLIELGVTVNKCALGMPLVLMTAERPDAKAAQAMRTMAAMATPAALATCLCRAAVEQRQRRR